MKRPTFLQGVGVALAAAVVAGVLYTALAPVLGAAVTVRALIAGLGLGYVLYLLRGASDRTGRITTVALWGVLATTAWWLAPSIAAYVLLHTGLLWLVRALYFHASVLGALADLALAGFGLAAGIAALVHTGSLGLAVWCFFLAQALFVAIPADLRGRKAAPGIDPSDPFQHAHEAAEAALRRLSTVR